MKLRKKAPIIIGVTFVVMIVFLYATSRIVLVGSFAKLEKQNARQNVERALSALSDGLSTLDATAYDWAAWDDTYAFIEDTNDDYIESNLVDGTFTALRLNLMLFINPSGETVFGKGFDLHNEKEIPVPQSLQEHLSPNNLLLRHPDTESSIKGIVSLPEDPMLIASRPILTSEDKGPIRGALIMGRYLDNAEIKRLAEITRLPLTVRRFDDSQMPPDFQAAVSSVSGETPILVRPLSEQSIAGYTLLKDIYGKPILVLRADMPRDIYEQGQATISYFILSLLTISLASGVGTMLLLKKEVLSPLASLTASLSKSVSSVGESGDLSVRVSITGRNELSSLADEINGMLESLEQSQIERKRMEEKSKQILLELERSNKELEQFAYMASHDLQEPLRMVASYVQLLERRYKGKLDADADDFIAYAVDGATRMQKLINDLLTYSRVSTRGKPFEPTNCSAVLDQTLANLEMSIEESGAVVTHDALPTVMADASQLVQLFQNLIGNAIKFRGEEPPRVHVSAEQKENEWIFSVRDNSMGIDPQYAERIFQVFQRLHTRTGYPGTGIGLAVCRRIVERHGGCIWVESEPGKGSTFYFTIPVKGKGGKQP